MGDAKEIKRCYQRGLEYSKAETFWLKNKERGLQYYCNTCAADIFKSLASIVIRVDSPIGASVTFLPSAPPIFVLVDYGDGSYDLRSSREWFVFSDFRE